MRLHSKRGAQSCSDTRIFDCRFVSLRDLFKITELNYD